MGSLDLKSHYTDILFKNGIFDKIAEIETFEPTDLVGEHMCSVCEYVTVKFQDKTKKDAYFFVKRPVKISDPLQNEMFAQVMVKEGIFLTKFVSEMNQFCAEKLGTDNDLLRNVFPRTLYAEKDAIVMENIAKQGYFMANKFLRQDFNQAKIVLETLAKFHAVSHILIKNAGSHDEFLKKYPTMFDITLAPGTDAMICKIFDPCFELIMKMIKNSGNEEAESALVKLEKYNGAGLVFKTLEQSLTSDTFLHCVNHGDCWNNNMMFSPNRDRVTLLDLQVNRIGSPCLDLSYYLFTSTRQEVLSEWKQLLKIYYDEFKSISLKLGHAVDFSFEDLLKDFALKSELGFVFGLFMSVGLDAIKGHDTQTVELEENAFEFETMSTKFLEENTDKINGIVENILYQIKIFENIKFYA